METNKELQRVEKQESSELAEQTREGRVFTPPVDIFESEGAIIVLADMPGVRPEDLRIDLREGRLTMTGTVKVPEDGKEELVYREYDTGTFYRQFTISDVIDQDKIAAKLSDGVLRLELPKADKAKPRKIQVTAA